MFSLLLFCLKKRSSEELIYTGFPELQSQEKQGCEQENHTEEKNTSGRKTRYFPPGLVSFRRLTICFWYPHPLGKHFFTLQ